MCISAKESDFYGVAFVNSKYTYFQESVINNNLFYDENIS